MKTILSHANLIDCVEPQIRPDTAVLIENGRIRAILPSGEAGSAGDAKMMDLKGGYLMPGLWDVHIHPDYLSLAFSSPSLFSLGRPEMNVISNTIRSSA